MAIGTSSSQPLINSLLPPSSFVKGMFLDPVAGTLLDGNSQLRQGTASAQQDHIPAPWRMDGSDMVQWLCDVVPTSWGRTAPRKLRKLETLVALLLVAFQGERQKMARWPWWCCHLLSFCPCQESSQGYMDVGF